MSDQDYNNLRTATEDIFKDLYILDVGSMTPTDRADHQKALSAAYLAVVRIENNAFTDLTASAAAKIPQLAAQAKALDDQLSGLKKATEVIQIVTGSLNLLGSIAKLLK